MFKNDVKMLLCLGGNIFFGAFFSALLFGAFWVTLFSNESISSFIVGCRGFSSGIINPEKI